MSDEIWVRTIRSGFEQIRPREEPVPMALAITNGKATTVLGYQDLAQLAGSLPAGTTTVYTGRDSWLSIYEPEEVESFPDRWTPPVAPRNREDRTEALVIGRWTRDFAYHLVYPYHMDRLGRLGRLVWDEPRQFDEPLESREGAILQAALV